MAKTDKQAQAASGGGESTLENDKHEAFARQVARGGEAVDAYRAVYGGTERSVVLRAGRLMRNAAVSARVAFFDGRWKMEDGK